jgi:hypothetical protein
MKNYRIFGVAFLSLLLVACGGGGEPPAAVLTQVSASAAPTPAVSQTPPSVPTPSVVPSVPATVSTDVTLTGVRVNVKRRTVNVGEYAVNLAAFTASFDPMKPVSLIQRLVFRNRKPGNSYELFTAMRFVSADGTDVCNPTYLCYVDWGAGGVVTVYFPYGWRTTSELQVFALQGDVSSTVPSGSQFAFELIDVQMHQWQTSEEHGAITGGMLEVTTVVPLPVIISSVGAQWLSTAAGAQYNVLNVSVTCPAGCLFTQMKIYSEAADLYYSGYTYNGATNVTQLPSGQYAIDVNQFINPGAVITLSFNGTATGNTIYSQAFDFMFTVDGIVVQPVMADPNTAIMEPGGKG